MNVIDIGMPPNHGNYFNIILREGGQLKNLIKTWEVVDSR
jgi:hypothetical protein